MMRNETKSRMSALLTPLIAGVIGSMLTLSVVTQGTDTSDTILKTNNEEIVMAK